MKVEDGVGVEDVLPGEAAVAEAARHSLEGRKRGLRGLWPFLGPAFIAAVAYIDPGQLRQGSPPAATWPSSAASASRAAREERRRILGFEKVDVVLALSLAGLVNLSMMIVAADREVMGDLVNPGWLSALAGVLATLIIALNVFLLFEVFTG